MTWRHLAQWLDNDAALPSERFVSSCKTVRADPVEARTTRPFILRQAQDERRTPSKHQDERETRSKHPGQRGAKHQGERKVDWLRVAPFIGLHLACLAAFWVGVSATALFVAAALYALRMFAITAFYHRYFSHRAFRTSRLAQFLFALLAATAAQRGPLWWVSQHRHHHAHADAPADSHSALQHGFLWSHVGWFLARENFATRAALVKDLARYPELRFLDRFDVLAPLALGIVLYAAGEALASLKPDLGVSGLQLVVWGACISTVVLYHATFTINSLAHRYGRRRYATRDDSRNNGWLAVLTFGEGWHNNHHHYAGAARQGFYWWEVDLTYYALRILQALGIVWDLKEVPAAVREATSARAGETT